MSRKKNLYGLFEIPIMLLGLPLFFIVAFPIYLIGGLTFTVIGTINLFRGRKNPWDV